MNTPAMQYLASASPGANGQRAATFLASTIGRKVVMAVSGLVLFGFVVGHMVGNLQVYLGAEALNAYAVFLREFLHGAGIWMARTALLAALALHIWAATSLTLDNRAARPVGYRQTRHQESTYASRTMVWSGPILLLFIAYHLMHFTFGNLHPDFREGDVYHNFVVGFRAWPVSLFYVLAMLALSLHMYHGVWSMLQTLGFSHPRFNPLRHAFSSLTTVVVAAGNISFPLAVLSGFLHE